MKSSGLKKVEDETALLEKIGLVIPGFKGYKKKEMRREADKIVRENIYRKLTGAKSSLREVFQTLAKNKMMDDMKATDKLIAKFDRVSETINHAPHGYAGFFDAVKIHEDDLERMMDFDLNLVESAKEIEAEAKQFKQEIHGGKYENAGTHLDKITELMDALESAFDGRKEAIMGVEV